MGILSIDLYNINFDDTNYKEDDPETTIYVKLLAWHSKFEKRKALKKEINEKLMFVVFHPKIPKRWWNFCIPGNEKKEIEQILTE